MNGEVKRVNRRSDLRIGLFVFAEDFLGGRTDEHSRV
jgi:hypothetical protein